MEKPFVFVTRKITASAIRRLEEAARLEVWPHEDPPPYSLLLERAKTADALLTLLTDKIDSHLIENAGERLKVISQMAVGFDNIDTAAATRRGIMVGNTPGVLTETTADFTWALMMAAARRVVESDKEVRAGVWRSWGPDVLTGFDIYQSTLGIIGFGRIGKAVARRAKGFDMRILYTDPDCGDVDSELGAECASLEDLLKQSDFVTLHVYYSKETHHMIGREQLRMMKPTSILINTARGPVVDPEALHWALTNEIIAGAALDVTEPEPIPQNSPLLSLSNIIITPHIASASKATRERMAHIAVDNVLAGLAGERLLHCANPDVYRDRP